MIKIGSVIFVGPECFPIRYGILVDYNSVVWMYVNHNIEMANVTVVISTIYEFCKGHSYICDPNPKYDIIMSQKRALQSVGLVYPDNYFSITGDEFVYWCISGNCYSDVLNNCFYFGKHISATFKDMRLFKAMHHGIGIENNLVIHFFTESPNGNKALFSKKEYSNYINQKLWKFYSSRTSETFSSGSEE